MITEFVDRFMENKHLLVEYFSKGHPTGYIDIVKEVVNIISTDKYEDIDPGRVHQIDDGDYQGTLLFVIAANNYQPDKYWFVKVNYGSCSGCDTLEGIRAESEWDSCGNKLPPNKQQIEDYMSLALHVVQGLKEMN